MGALPQVAGRNVLAARRPRLISDSHRDADPEVHLTTNDI